MTKPKKTKEEIFKIIEERFPLNIGERVWIRSQNTRSDQKDQEAIIVSLDPVCMVQLVDDDGNKLGEPFEKSTVHLSRVHYYHFKERLDQKRPKLVKDKVKDLDELDEKELDRASNRLQRAIKIQRGEIKSEEKKEMTAKPRTLRIIN